MTSREYGSDIVAASASKLSKCSSVTESRPNSENYAGSVSLPKDASNTCFCVQRRI